MTEGAGEGVEPVGGVVVVAGFARVEVGDPFGVLGDLDERGGEDVVIVSGAHAAGPDSSSQNPVSH